MARSFGGAGYKKSSRLSPAILLFVAVTVIGVSATVGLLMIAMPHKDALETPTVVTVEKQVPMEMAEVLVPVQAIGPGTPLTSELFRRESRPRLGLPGRVATDFEEIRNLYARTQLPSGQPIQREQMTAVRPTNPITANIPQGYRAVTISVDARSSVEGWARPGAKVDVSWTAPVRGQAGISVIVQNAKVLSAERQMENNQQPGAPIPATVTLLVSADDASKIQLAQSTGTLGLTLRGDTDRGRGTELRSLTASDLLGGGLPPGVVATGPIIRVRGKDGRVEELTLQNGKLVPVDTVVR